MFIAQLGLIVSTLVSVSAGNSLLRTVKEQQLQSHVRQDMSLQAITFPFFLMQTYSVAQAGASASVCSGLTASNSYKTSQCIVTQPFVAASGNPAVPGAAYKYDYGVATTTDAANTDVFKYTFTSETVTPTCAGDLVATDGSGVTCGLTGGNAAQTGVVCTRGPKPTFVDCTTSSVGTGSTKVANVATPVYSTYNKVTYADDTACSASTATSIVTLDASVTPFDSTACVASPGGTTSYKVLSCVGDNSVTVTKFTGSTVCGGSTITTVTVAACDALIGAKVRYSCPAVTSPWFGVTTYATAGTGAVTHATSTVSVAAGAACTGAINPVKTSYQLGVCVVAPIPSGGTLGTAYKYLLSAASTLPVLKYTYQYNAAAATAGTQCGAGTIASPDYTCNGDSAAVSGNCIKTTQVAELNCLNTAAYTYVGPAVTYDAPKSQVALLSAADVIFNTYNRVTYTTNAACLAPTDSANLLLRVSVDSSAIPFVSTVCVASPGGTTSYKVLSCVGASVTVTKWAASTTCANGATSTVTVASCGDALIGTNVRFNCPGYVSNTYYSAASVAGTLCAAATNTVLKTSTNLIGVCVTTQAYVAAGTNAAQSGIAYVYNYATSGVTPAADAAVYKYVITNTGAAATCAGIVLTNGGSASYTLTCTSTGGTSCAVTAVSAADCTLAVASAITPAGMTVAFQNQNKALSVNSPIVTGFSKVTYTTAGTCATGLTADIVASENVATFATLYSLVGGSSAVGATLGCVTVPAAGAVAAYSYRIDSCVGSAVTVTTYTGTTCAAGAATALKSTCDALFGGSVRFNCPAAIAPAAAAASSSSDDKVCFAGSESVSLEDGSSKQISEVEIGDRILSADMDGTTGFSSVIALAHPKNDILTTFVHIETASADLKVTPDHLLLASADCTSMKLTAAAAVTVDSCIMTINGPARVEATSEIVEAGIYSVVTEKELIVVNGIFASPFAVNHAVANKYYDIHRVLFALFPAALTSSVFKTIHFGISAFVGSL